MSDKEKDPIYTRIALAGESDSGKTFSSAILAGEIVGLKRTHIIDTENRAKLYRTKFDGVKIITMDPPFEPEKLAEEFKKIPRGDLVIVDSATFFWERLVQVSEQMAETVKDKRRIWAKLTPRWDAFKMIINNAPLHLITTWKVKDVVPANVGDQPTKRVITRGGGKGLKFDYHIVFNLNEKRQAMVMKDNYDLFSDWKEPRMITADVGKKIAKWLKEN